MPTQRLRPILVALILAFLYQPAHAISDAEVKAGIQKLVKQLYSTQNANGHWEPGGFNERKKVEGGLTALITYALLTAGESYQNPKIAKALNYLKKVKMEGVYSRGVRAHVWAALPDRFRKYLKEDIYWLQAAAHKVNTGGIGFWYLKEEQAATQWDNSAIQYGVLGLWEGAKRGETVGGSLWAGVEKHFINDQNPDGGWGYSATAKGTRASMVTAGLALLFITQDYVHRSDYKQVGRAMNHPLQKRIDKALEWLGKNYIPGKVVGYNRRPFYYMYGIERVGLASGYKYFNKQDWYSSGAEWLLQQAPTNHEAAFSLLFLVRGRVPVFINKLEIPGKHWNNRPRDVDKLTRWISDTVEREMLWQIVNINTRAESWLDAPMLYLASHQALGLDSAQRAKIKRYIDMGGLLITTADSGAKAFNDEIQKILAEMYPRYKLKDIPDNDEIYNLVFKLANKKIGAKSIHNGIRHLVIHLPRDVSWTFHADQHSDQGIWQFMANTYYYATEKGRIRPRLDSHVLKATRKPAGPEVIVGRAKYDGNWNPEPQAWKVQKIAMANDAKGQVTTQVIPLADIADSGLPFVHVVGTEEIEFRDAELQAIKSFVQAGGTIFFEDAGGRGDFSLGIEDQISGLFERRRFRRLEAASPIITGKAIRGYDLSKISFRPYTILRRPRAEKTHRLDALNINGSPRIILSGDDLTAAILGQPVWGVMGYSTDSARKLMTNITLYGVKPK